MTNDSTSTIPKIIHQIWYQGSAGIPRELRAYCDGWKAKHPDWEYRVWDHDAARKLIAEKYSDCLQMWDRYPLDIQRIDSMRYFILHAQGGIYLDMDIECLKPIDPLLRDCDFLLSRTTAFNMAVMASTAGHEFWPHIFRALAHSAQIIPYPPRLRRIIGSALSIYVAQTTGPRLFSETIQGQQLDAKPTTRVCPGYIFEPNAPTIVDGRIVYSNDLTQAYGIHHETMKWVSPLNRAIAIGTRYLFRLLYSGKK